MTVYPPAENIYATPHVRYLWSCTYRSAQVILAPVLLLYEYQVREIAPLTVNRRAAAA